MTGKLISRSQARWFFAFGCLALAVVGTEWAVVHSIAFGQQPDMISLGITLDFILGIPLAYYFLIVRPVRVSRGTLLVVIMLSGYLAGFILPTANHRYLGYWERLMAMVEVGALALVALRGRTMMRNFWALQVHNPDFIINLQQSLIPIIGHGRLTSVLVGEISLLRYSLFGWIGGIERKDSQRAYSTHRESGQIALMCALLAIILIETAVTHLLVARSYPAAAWLASAGSLYGLLFLIADMVALVKRPVLIDGNEIRLRLGLRWQGNLVISDVDRVSKVSEAPQKSRATLNGCFLVTPNVLIKLHRPIRIDGLLGVSRLVQYVALFVDDRDDFIRSLTPPAESTPPVYG